MKDLRLPEILGVNRGPLQALLDVGKIRNTALRAICESFVQNVGRAVAPFEVIASIKVLSDLEAQSIDIVKTNMRRERPLVSPDPEAPEFDNALEFELWRAIFEHNQSSKSAPQVEAERRQHDLARIQYLSQYLDHSGEIGLESLLVSALIHTWIAWQAFTTDLWTESFNRNPDPALIEKFSIRASRVLRYGPDLKNRIGNLLVDEGRVSFGDLHAIRNAYRTFFGHAADRLFRKQTDALNRLQMYAHSFVHCSGGSQPVIVTKSAAMEPITPLPDKPPLIDGAETATLINSAILISEKLLVLADQHVADTARPSAR